MLVNLHYSYLLFTLKLINCYRWLLPSSKNKSDFVSIGWSGSSVLNVSHANKSYDS